MKIAINCAFFQPRGGGIKEYIQNLVENLSQIDNQNEYILYVLEDHLEYAKSHLKCKFQIKPIPFRGNGLINVITRSVFEKYFWRREEQRERWDVFHSPFFHMPTAIKSPAIMTVHDMRFYRFPRTYTFFRYHFLKQAVKRSVIRVDKIISISHFTKDEIIKAYGCSSDKIQVIHEAINIDKFSSCEIKLTTNELIGNSKFILTVGHLEPRKNYNRLIDAFLFLNRELGLKDYKLVIVGKKGHSYKKTLKKIKKHDNVIYLDFVSHELLVWLYKNAQLFVFPSYYEGFGFPPLEAAAAGIPATVSNLSSMPEICGNAVTYFNPYNIEEMAIAMKNTLTNETLRSQLLVNARKRLNEMSWINNAKETLKLYESLCNG